MREGVTTVDFLSPVGDQRPGFAAYASGWSRTLISPIKPVSDRLLAAVDALRASHVNGEAEVAQFHIDADAAVAWYLSRDQVEIDFFRDFFSHPAVLGALTMVSGQKDGQLGFHGEAPFVSFGHLANRIQRGGAYKSFAGTDAEVLKLTTDFAAAAIGLRFSESAVWESEEPWSSWFLDVAWDYSLFWLDKRSRIATVLLSTDTD